MIPEDVRREDVRLEKERAKIIRDGPDLKGAKLAARRLSSPLASPSYA